MTVRKSERNPFQGVRTFFVTSETEPEKEYIVQEIKRDGTVYYCNCSDFFYRRLPHVHTNLFSLCKHGAAVREAVNA
jgi:hypothetical protein